MIGQFGATPIDYENETVMDYIARHTQGRGFDIVFDTVGGATLDASFGAVRRYGHVVSALGWGSHALAPLSFRGATYSGIFTLLPLLTGEGRAHHGDIMREAAKLIDAGKLSVRLDPRKFSLSNIDDAHVSQNDGSAKGKIVIDVTEAQ